MQVAGEYMQWRLKNPFYAALSLVWNLMGFWKRAIFSSHVRTVIVIVPYLKYTSNHIGTHSGPCIIHRLPFESQLKRPR